MDIEATYLQMQPNSTYQCTFCHQTTQFDTNGLSEITSLTNNLLVVTSAHLDILKEPSGVTFRPSQEHISNLFSHHLSGVEHYDPPQDHYHFQFLKLLQRRKQEKVREQLINSL
jgi:hypothetical protein